jgi:hypothetical protein
MISATNCPLLFENFIFFYKYVLLFNFDFFRVSLPRGTNLKSQIASLKTIKTFKIFRFHIYLENGGKLIVMINKQMTI